MVFASTQGTPILGCILGTKSKYSLFPDLHMHPRHSPDIGYFEASYLSVFNY